MKITSEMNSSHTDFDRLFNPIFPEETGDYFNIFTLAGKDFYAITAGKYDHFNSMIGSGGGFGLLFRKPVTWCILRSDRYTLELILQEKSYTLSYFPDSYREQMLFLGSKSGRDSEKMKETRLTSIQTPSGNMSFQEAKLIIECNLTQITTPDLGDLCTQEAKDYLAKSYEKASDYRQYLYGGISHVWIKKQV